MTFRGKILITVLAGSLAACATSPLGRNQFLLMPEDQMNEMGATAYAQIKQETPVSKDQRQTAYVRCVTDAITTTLADKQSWEVNLFDDNAANAFALPGGKIGVNTGLLKVAKNQSQLATVIGHEIGHVQAQHSNERMSLEYATQNGLGLLGTIAGQDTAVKQGIFAALGLGAEYGVTLPFSRKHEAEADIVGLQLMANAGFDPRESVNLWINMAASNGGEPPEFMSTHPSNETRINGLQSKLPEVMPLYNKAKAAGRNPSCG
ncbi:M48 family metallopeptidase [Alcanivorax sp.]|uniref:M48 family metallopeptidase n=1 Tax=Alcanivorax sp. TaxID=1872427 RepID=UPI00243D8B6D|nr:M48 family metallopeptidase [Alcanivorax sp.]